MTTSAPSHSITGGSLRGIAAHLAGARATDLFCDRPVRILLAEDDDDVRRVLAKALERPKWQVDEAADGEAAWAAHCGNRYDLIITDHRMPRLTGLELIMRVRAERPDLPCILISGEFPAEPAELDLLIRPGQTLGKPFMLHDLVVVVNAALTAHARDRSVALPAETLCEA